MTRGANERPPSHQGPTGTQIRHKIPAARGFKYIKPRVATGKVESIQLQRLVDGKGRTMGYVDADTGALYNRKHRLTDLVVPRSGFLGMRRSQGYQRLREAADKLGIEVTDKILAYEKDAQSKIDSQKKDD